MVFLVKKCNPSTSIVTCASEDDIEKYVNRVSVDSWANHDEVDFSIHWDEPRIRKEVWIRSDVMKYGNVKTNWITMQRNDVETEDSWILIGATSWEFSFYTINIIKDVITFPTVKEPEILF